MNNTQYPWPQWLINAFTRITQPTNEKLYYPAYNMLLCEHFKGQDGYLVSPITYPIADRASIDFVVEYAVFRYGDPVLILEVKAPDRLKNKSARHEADDQIRQRYESLLDSCPINKFIAISAFGTKLAFYEADKTTGRITPARIFRDPNIINDVAPIDWWQHNDILEPSCAQKIINIFDFIKEECTKIPNI